MKVSNKWPGSAELLGTGDSCQVREFSDLTSLVVCFGPGAGPVKFSLEFSIRDASSSMNTEALLHNPGGTMEIRP